MNRQYPQMGDITSTISDEAKKLLDSYKGEAIKMGTQALLIQAVVFGVIVFLIIDAKVR